MRIMVTGGAGFIGSHIVDEYINSGHDVAIVDNLSMGSLRNINPEARFFNLSIQSPELESVFKEFRPEIINHHAAHINLRQSVTDPVYDAENNIIGSLNILNFCRLYDIRKIIFASTGGAIYGEPTQIPVSENASPIPLSPYGAGKLAIEHYLRIWNLVTGVDFTIFRYPNVFGPRQNPRGEAGVIAIFCLQILTKQRPTIFGDGTKTRDYLYISDLVRANVTALESGSGATLNLGWGLEISDQLVFDTVGDFLDYRYDPVYSSPRSGEVNRIALDATLAHHVLDWKPEVDFREGVRRSVRYYSERSEDDPKT